MCNTVLMKNVERRDRRIVCAAMPGAFGGGRRISQRVPIAMAALLVVFGSMMVGAQVTSDRIVRASEEPQNWLTHSGGYFSQRYSLLTQITPGNVRNLELKWILPNQVFGAWQA